MYLIRSSTHEPLLSGYWIEKDKQYFIYTICWDKSERSGRKEIFSGLKESYANIRTTRHFAEVCSVLRDRETFSEVYFKGSMQNVFIVIVYGNNNNNKNCVNKKSCTPLRWILCIQKSKFIKKICNGRGSMKGKFIAIKCNL